MKIFPILVLDYKRKEPDDGERRKLLRQAHEAIKILTDDKLKENVDKLQRDAGIKFR